MQGSRKKEDSSGKTTSLVDDFQTYFDIDLATTEELREKTYRIRYRVYCEEFKYEPIDHFPGQMEFDEFEEQSLHCLVTHKQTGTPAGCVRLVCVDEQQIMPMEKYCSHSLDRKFIDGLGVPRSSVCEFSRLAVDRGFRRRSGEEMSRFGALTAMDFSKREMRTFSLIAVSAFLAGFATSDLIGRRNCFAMMEPFLPRMLKRSGIHVHSAGSETDYHGLRAPYFITAEDAVNGLGSELHEFYDTIHQHFSQQINAATSQVASGPVQRSDVRPAIQLAQSLLRSARTRSQDYLNFQGQPGTLAASV